MNSELKAALEGLVDVSDCHYSWQMRDELRAIIAKFDNADLICPYIVQGDGGSNYCKLAESAGPKPQAPASQDTP